jgi:hypothetical protein
MRLFRGLQYFASTIVVLGGKLACARAFGEVPGSGAGLYEGFALTGGFTECLRFGN